MNNRTLANAIRMLSLDAVNAANSGHPGMPMGIADVATILFSKYLNIDVNKPDWPDRDRFVLSAGHGSMLIYALNYLLGYSDMNIVSLKNFRQLHSNTPGHPEYGDTLGVETTTGPLGQGLGTAVGMALAERMSNAKFGNNLVDHFTYVIVGDGCLQEGISHESIEFAGHLKLAKLIVFSRKGYDKKSKESIVVKYLNKKNIVYVNNKLIDVSSSKIKKNYLKYF